MRSMIVSCVFQPAQEGSDGPSNTIRFRATYPAVFSSIAAEVVSCVLDERRGDAPLISFGRTKAGGAWISSDTAMALPLVANGAIFCSSADALEVVEVGC